MQDGLLAQWDMLQAVIQSSWVKLIDVKVAHVIIDNYYKSKGLASISVRQIAAVTGQQHKYIVPAIRRLVDRGVISIARLGSGKRASEYSLNFRFGQDDPPSVVTTDTATSVVTTDTALGVHMDHAKVDSGVNVDTDPCLRNRSIDRLTISRTDGSPAGPTAPLAAGLTVRESMDRKTGARNLEAVDLYEISVVTFGMLPSATISRVKSGETDFARLVRAINAATAAFTH